MAIVTYSDNESYIWETLLDFFGNSYAAAGMMGNLYAESGLNPINMQNSHEKSLGFNDESYTQAVDSGTYNNFVYDSVGYGLAQWTYWSRKAGLKELQGEKGQSIGNICGQMEYLERELTNNYSSLLKSLKDAVTVTQASNLVLTEFEKPADQSDSVKEKRASYGMAFYDAYTIKNENKPDYEIYSNYKLLVNLAVRQGAGTAYELVGYENLTEDGKAHDTDKNSCLEAGTIVTCKNIVYVGDDIWMKIPSGYIAAYYKGEVFVSPTAESV